MVTVIYGFGSKQEVLRLYSSSLLFSVRRLSLLPPNYSLLLVVHHFMVRAQSSSGFDISDDSAAKISIFTHHFIRVSLACLSGCMVCKLQCCNIGSFQPPLFAFMRCVGFQFLCVTYSDVEALVIEFLYFEAIFCQYFNYRLLQNLHSKFLHKLSMLKKFDFFRLLLLWGLVPLVGLTSLLWLMNPL